MLKRINSVLNRQSAVIEKLKAEISACEERERCVALIVTKSREIEELRRKLGALRAKEPDLLVSVQRHDEEIERIKRELYPKPNPSTNTATNADADSDSEDDDDDAPVP
jgi:hypothetical protein